MWPAIYSPGIRAFQADALFVSALQRSDEPSVGQVRQAITAAVRAFGRAGCPNGWRRSLAIIPKRR